MVHEPKKKKNSSFFLLCQADTIALGETKLYQEHLKYTAGKKEGAILILQLQHSSEFKYL